MPTAYITAPSDSATELARNLVEGRLAACVNLVDCRSIYRWKGDIVDNEEVILLAKTTAERYDRLVERATELHPYDVPCIERFDEVDVLPEYGGWIRDETGPVEG